MNLDDGDHTGMNLGDYSCCPFKSTPGRFAGAWWSGCIHGLYGQRQKLLMELQEVEDKIVKLQMEKRNKW